jgi:hypothetical protein
MHPLPLGFEAGLFRADISSFRFILTLDVTSSGSQVPGQWIVNSAPGVRASHTPFVFFQATVQSCNWTMVLAMPRFRRHVGSGTHHFFGMFPIRTLVSVDTLVQ